MDCLMTTSPSSCACHPLTVKTHINRTTIKLNARDRAQLVQLIPVTMHDLEVVETDRLRLGEVVVTENHDAVQATLAVDLFEEPGEFVGPRGVHDQRVVLF